MAETEVTQGHWKSVMGTVPWKDKDHTREGAGYPANYVSWNDATEFCKRLSDRERRDYRLPTEAEWEFVCRVGSTTRYDFGESVAQRSDYAWFDRAAIDGPFEVKKKLPNNLGIYDIRGNVREWCIDWWEVDTYQRKNGITSDPVGAEEWRIAYGPRRKLDRRSCSVPIGKS